MKITEKFFTKDFKSNKSKKDAYLEACKFVASNIISKEKNNEKTFWSISQEKTDSKGFVYRLELYSVIDTSKDKESFCKTCKEFHRSFYMRDEPECSRCNVRTYLDRLNKKIKIKSQYRKEKLSYILNK